MQPKKIVQKPTSPDPMFSQELDALNKPPARRKSLAFFIGAAVAAIGLALLVFIVVRNYYANSPSGFSAVYLTSGDILVGKLSLSPTPTLTDVWLVSKSSTSSVGPINLIPFKTTSVSPDNEAHLNPQQILYWANLDPTSPLVQQLTARTS